MAQCWARDGTVVQAGTHRAGGAHRPPESLHAGCHQVGRQAVGPGWWVEVLCFLSAPGQSSAVSEDSRGVAAPGDRWAGKSGHLAVWKETHMGGPWGLT